MDGYYEFDESGQGKQVSSFVVTFTTVTVSPAGGGWRVCHGEEDVEQADEGDLDPAGGV